MYEEVGPSAALAIECERRFQSNLRALARTAPHLVDLARSTPLVVTFLSRARDGSIACRLETAGGGRPWIGGCVVPRSAATRMVAGLDLPESGHFFLAPFDGAHCLAPLADTTYQHQRIFVLEHDREVFAGTLMVTDLARVLESGRVVLFVGPDLGEQVADYLRRHPWQPVPERLITTSTRREVVAAYRHVVETATRLLAGRPRKGRRGAA